MKTKLFNLILCTFFILFLVCSTSVLASDTNALNSDTSDDILASYETNYSFVSSDVFLFQNDVELSEIVDGNVFIFGQNINITGEIYGDLLVFADSLNIAENAAVHGNIFAYATNISISGIVSDVYAFSDSFRLEEPSIIARNLYLTANTATLNGQVSRDAYLSTTSLNFATENNEAIIEGDLHYTSPTELSIADNVVGGEIAYTAPATDTGNLIASAIVSIITSLIFSFVVIMLLLWIAPKFKDRASEILAKKSFKAFGIGILVFFAVIICAIILLIFTYGFFASTALIGILALILAMSISNTIFSMALGKIIANKFNSASNIAYVLISLLIVLVIELIGYIPYVGAPITYLTALIGFGIICMNAYKRKDLVNSEAENK